MPALNFSPAKRRVWACALLLAAVCAGPAAADFVFLLDGHTLQGSLRKEGELISEPGAEIFAPKVGWVMDDGVRKIYFHQRQIAQVQKDPPGLEPKTESFKLKQPRNPFQGALQNISLDAVGPWQPSGLRKVSVRARRDMPQEIEQYLTLATPTLLKASARIHRWDMPMLPSEIAPADLFAILRNHPDGLKDQPEEVVAERLQRFCLEAGWLDEAAALRAEHQKKGMEANERLLRLHAELDRQLAFRADQDIQLAAANGQHLRAQQLLDSVNDERATDAVLTRLRLARTRAKQQGADLEALRRCFHAARRGCKSQALMVGTRAVVEEIERDLTIDSVGRLEAFLKLARQEERLRDQGQPSMYSDDQLLALAVSGWLLGPKGADARESLAIQLCQGRDFVQRYLALESKAERDKLLYQYQLGDALRVDEMAQLLQWLPPLAPDPDLAPTERVRTTPPSEHWPDGLRYHVKRPPEYHPQRAYPVLILLPNAGPVAADPKVLLEWWGPHADRHGYLVALPEWRSAGQKSYGHTAREHAAVHELIRDLRRRDNIDGDRIAISGFDQAGVMAYDVALSRPDRFAAAAVICGMPSKFSKQLENNAQYLPFYVVDGEKDFRRPDQTRRLFDYWLARGFPSLYCEYFQRGFEDYRHEIPFIMDWLQRKRLAKGLPDLGKEDVSGAGNLGQPMRCLRPEDQRLYWLRLEDHGGTPSIPAEAVAKQLTGNSYQIKVQRVRKLSVWLSPAMVDFEQPVEIRVNPGGGGPTFEKAVKPSLETLLEDFHERGDRQSLFYAKVDIDLSRR